MKKISLNEFVVSEFDDMIIDMNYSGNVASIHASFNECELVMDFCGNVTKNIYSFPEAKIEVLKKWVEQNAKQIVFNHIALDGMHKMKKIPPCYNPNYEYGYTIRFFADYTSYKKLCRDIEKEIPNLTFVEELHDVDDNRVSIYFRDNKQLAIYNDLYLNEIYIKSEFSIDDYIKRNYEKMKYSLIVNAENTFDFYVNINDNYDDGWLTCDFSVQLKSTEIATVSGEILEIHDVPAIIELITNMLDGKLKEYKKYSLEDPILEFEFLPNEQIMNVHLFYCNGVPTDSFFSLALYGEELKTFLIYLKLVNKDIEINDVDVQRLISQGTINKY